MTELLARACAAAFAGAAGTAELLRRRGRLHWIRSGSSTAALLLYLLG